MRVYELNMDGLVGPTHHYGGLSEGNIASKTYAESVSNPQQAALQGLQKMRFLHHLGLKQALIPPHQRPNLPLLHQLGFDGHETEQIQKAALSDPRLLSACFSASSMWAANAATVSSSIDTKDRRVHFTAANLVSNLHRHHEADFSYKLLQRIFADERYFVHHEILPKTTAMGDEGAANHSRLCEHHGSLGTHLFVYGKRAFSNDAPTHFPARQTLEASEANARSHQLPPPKVVFAQQNKEAIDQGVFHNDVIAVANESLLLLHEKAFVNQAEVLTSLKIKAGFPLHVIEINQKQLSIGDAVKTYLFNSQLVTLPSTTHEKVMALIAPIECKEHSRLQALLEDIVKDPTNPIHHVHYLSLKQSMHNGGGPACLRLRVPLNEDELAAMHQGIMIHDALLDTLEIWVKKHYRTKLHLNDLQDPSLVLESFAALDELTTLLQLGSIYPFQREKCL